MIRKFTQDVGGTADNPRYKAGTIKDFPTPTWRRICEGMSKKAKKAKDFIKILDSFSEPVEIS